MIFTGGGPASMVRTCTGEVCERSTRLPLPAGALPAGAPLEAGASTKKVSCMSRAGWSAGVLRASKLFHSVSTQGPVRTS